MQNLFWLFRPCSSLLIPNTHCMFPGIPKYLRFKNSHILSWLCPWANFSLFLKWLSRHLDFLKKIFFRLNLTCLSRLTWVVSQRIKSEALLRIPWSELQATCFKSQSTLCTPVRASCAQNVISQDWPSRAWICLALHRALDSQSAGFTSLFWSFYFCVLSRSGMSYSWWPHGL